MRYQVRYGDSPAIIARRFGVTMPSLINANPQRPTATVAGQRTWRSLQSGETVRVPVGVGDGYLGAVAPAPINGPHAIIHQGSSGADVALAQQLLSIPADGSFGGQTDAAVRAFQASQGLTADGYVGPATWAALINASGGGAAPTPVAPVIPGLPALPAIPGLPAVPSLGLAVPAGAALAALTMDPNYCSNVAKSGSAVNTAVHNFKAAWNAANPGQAVPIGTGKYEPSVAAALSSALGGVQVPPGCGAGAQPAPVAPPPVPVIPSLPPIPGLPPVPAPTAVTVAAGAAVAALTMDPNYCTSVANAGSPVNSAVHNFKAAWNAANPGQAVPIGTGKYEPVVASALSSALGGVSVPPGCGAGPQPVAPPLPIPVIPPGILPPIPPGVIPPIPPILPPIAPPVAPQPGPIQPAVTPPAGGGLSKGVIIAGAIGAVGLLALVAVAVGGKHTTTTTNVRRSSTTRRAARRPAHKKSHKGHKKARRR